MLNEVIEVIGVNVKQFSYAVGGPKGTLCKGKPFEYMKKKHKYRNTALKIVCCELWVHNTIQKESEVELQKARKGCAHWGNYWWNSRHYRLSKFSKRSYRRSNRRYYRRSPIWIHLLFSTCEKNGRIIQESGIEPRITSSPKQKLREISD